MATITTNDCPGDQPYVALHLLRALIAIGILSNHWADQYYPGLIPQQQLTIDLFFAIEGFLIAATLARDGSETWRPILRRLISVYPLFLIALLAGIMLMAPVASVQEHGWSWSVFERAAMLGSILQPTFSAAAEGAVFPFNPPSWAIVLELWGFAALWLMRDRLTTRILAGLCSIAAVLTVMAIFHYHDLNLGWQTNGYWGGFPRMAYGLFGGMLTYRLMQARGQMVPSLHPLLVCSVFVAMLFLRIRFVGLPLWLVAVPALVWFGAASANLKWLISVSQQAGGHAYAIYVLHFPVLVGYRALGEYLRVPREMMSSPFSYLLALAAALLVAHLVTRLVAPTDQ